MRPGRRIAGRFELDRAAGAGGMATVYLARDVETGGHVAVKVLRGASPHEVERFAREAKILAELGHPAVARYVAHGVMSAEEARGDGTIEPGAQYLVMEWLEGEDLGARMEREGLTIAESVSVARQVAEALAAVHARGVVHRDIKPSNLFLVGGALDAVKVIDFGIARLDGATSAQTRTGDTLGTPGYMAPEQARGERDVDARADLFSLGCVLFRCLTGVPAFHAEHVMAVLAKVLLEEAPPVESLRPEVPAPLADLVARLLCKDSAGRPDDAAAVVAAIEALGSIAPDSAALRAPAGAPSPGLTATEIRLASVLLVGARGPADAPLAEAESALRDLALRHRASFDRLADGTHLMTMMSAGAATDQAERAARCAIAARALAPGRPMALSTGRATVSGLWPMGEAMDRAAQLLWAAQRAATAAGDPRAVFLDTLTAGLLGPRFDVVAEAGELVLRGASEPIESARTLLGKPTTCVGRDRELAMLEAIFEESFEAPAARVVVVTAPAGGGKSRLRYELVRRLAAKGFGDRVWLAGGDPMRAGAPLGMLAEIVRRVVDLRDGEPLEARRDKIRARVERSVEPSHRARVAEFLGELVGAPFPEEHSVQLRAARRDPLLLGDQTRRAWVDFLGAECRAHPVALVLEDLHWGDRPTVEYVDTALRLLGDAPLLVLALGRPEVDDLFPGLFRERDLTQIRLPALSRKACTELARQLLGAEVEPEALARLWERSGGNAFFLEELIRAEVEGRGEAPDTVLAMVQSRIEGLEPEARRVLRAGSVFGRAFWRGAASVLLGTGTRSGELDRWLVELERRELVTSRPTARFQGEREYVFRQALVREAAYGMLTDEDRVLGHRLAGEWLERAGETDAMVLAEHFDRGDAPARALGSYRRAGEQALEANDLAGALVRVERAVACGAMGEALGELALIRAEAHGWRGETMEAEESALAAMRDLPPRTPRWYEAVREVVGAASKLAHNEPLAVLGQALLDGWSAPDAIGPQVVAMVRASLHLFNIGYYDLAWAIHRSIESVADRFRDDPPVAAMIAWARAARALFAGDSARFRAENVIATEHYERAGNVRGACNQRVGTGYACNELGAYAEAAVVLREALADAERMGLQTVAIVAKHNLGLSLAHLGALDEARAVEVDAAEGAAKSGIPRIEGASRIYLAAIHELAGDLDAAAAEARLAIARLTPAPPVLATALARFAMILLAQGAAVEALEHARHAAEILASLGIIEEGESLVRLAHAEALEANGDHVAAQIAVAAARRRLMERAEKIEDPAFRASFLERVPEHARTLERAYAWLDEQGAPRGGASIPGG